MSIQGVHSGRGICGVFAVVSEGYLGGIWGYLRLGGDQFGFQAEINILLFAWEVFRKWPWEGPAAHARISRKNVTINPLV